MCNIYVIYVISTLDPIMLKGITLNIDSSRQSIPKLQNPKETTHVVTTYAHAQAAKPQGDNPCHDRKETSHAVTA